MNKKMTHWINWKTQNTCPMDVLNDMKMDVDCAIAELKEGNEKALLKIVYDIYCDASLFLKDFGTTPDEIEEEM